MYLIFHIHVYTMFLSPVLSYLSLVGGGGLCFERQVKVKKLKTRSKIFELQCNNLFCLPCILWASFYSVKQRLKRCEGWSGKGLMGERG